jgi:hypothetical protein
MEKGFIAFGHEENHDLGFSPVWAFRRYIVKVVPQTAASKGILADSHHTGICLKGIIDGLGLIFTTSTIRLPNKWASSETVSPHDPNGMAWCACAVFACRPIHAVANATKSIMKRGKRLRMIIICSPR